ncbi:UNVERIFIED_ORG: hypothetical protein FHR35_008210 [Microbispora rosea subsp. rosea]
MLLTVDIPLGQLLDLFAAAPPLRLGGDALPVDLLEGIGKPGVGRQSSQVGHRAVGALVLDAGGGRLRRPGPDDCAHTGARTGDLEHRETQRKCRDGADDERAADARGAAPAAGSDVAGHRPPPREGRPAWMESAGPACAGFASVAAETVRPFTIVRPSS